MAQATAGPAPVPPQEAEQWAEAWVARWSKLAEEIILGHPFVARVQRGELSREGVARFTENWYEWARTVGMSGACLYHRHLAVFKLHPDLDAHVLGRIAEEVIRPSKPGHAHALEALFPALGIPAPGPQPRGLIREMRGFAFFMRRLHLEGTFAEVHSCQYGPNMAPFARIWREALTTHYGVSPEATLYWQEYADFDTRPSGGGILGTRQENLFVLSRIKERGLVEARPGWGMDYTAETSLRMWELFLTGCHKTLS
jgi:hypothetical protein